MLFEPQITAFIPTIQPKLAKEFYKNILGLKLVSEDDYALEFEGKGASLRITVVEDFVPQAFTVLGFKVTDIVKEVKSLSEREVSFENYSGMEQDKWGIWTAPSRAKIAWFKDPDGNLISLTQYPS